MAPPRPPPSSAPRCTRQGHVRIGSWSPPPTPVSRTGNGRLSVPHYSKGWCRRTMRPSPQNPPKILDTGHCRQEHGRTFYSGGGSRRRRRGLAACLIKGKLIRREHNGCRVQAEDPHRHARERPGGEPADYIRQILPHGFESLGITFWETCLQTDLKALAGQVKRASTARASSFRTSRSSATRSRTTRRARTRANRGSG